MGRGLDFADRITMYEQHFGLKKRPFLAKARGGDVFVGPQTANTMAGLKKALTAQDAIVSVSGSAGVGKTTLVAKALEALSGSHRSIRIGRMQLEGTDALEFLLEELGTRYPAHAVDISMGEQFDPDFTAIAPNNRIPAIVDRETGTSLMESGAIMLYLAQKYRKFLRGGDECWRVVDWMMWQLGRLGPMP